MTASVAELMEQLASADPNERALALAALVEHGGSATPALTRALGSPVDAVRAQAAQALAEIADPSSADALAAALDDGNPEVRARAANGLARVRDPRALGALLRTIDDFPDVLHHPYTLSVYGLIGLGQAALPAVVPLLEADDPATRERALLVVRTLCA